MRSLLILLFFVSYSTQSQTLPNKPWEINCGEMETQLDMNLCSLESYQIADSILTLRYDSLTNLIHKQYIRESKFKIPDKEYIHILTEQQADIQKSKTDFYSMRDRLEDFMYKQYNGGTIAPLTANSFALEITVKQIEIIEMLIADFYPQ